jgi:hypothetical protein
MTLATRDSGRPDRDRDPAEPPFGAPLPRVRPALAWAQTETGSPADHEVVVELIVSSVTGLTDTNSTLRSRSTRSNR